MYDNKTEHLRTINILERFNIYQEVILGVLYRLLSLKVCMCMFNEMFVSKYVQLLSSLFLEFNGVCLFLHQHYFWTSWAIHGIIICCIMVVEWLMVCWHSGNILFHI